MLCINTQSRINIKKDTICSALLKKSNHDKLSSKTLSKLAKIASSSLGLYKPDAKELFINNKRLTPSGSSIILAYNITKVLALVSNDNLRSQLKEFISHCRAPSFYNKERVGIPYSGTPCSLATSEFIIKNSDRIGATVGEGLKPLWFKIIKTQGRFLKFSLMIFHTMRLRDKQITFDGFMDMKQPMLFLLGLFS